MKRPEYHFTPDRGWMNDPNGTIYVDGNYHLFYQYYPDALTWGPMHWGHAVSEDLLHWERRKTALCPDENGYVFSGSCYYDRENRSGLADDGKMPLLAFYTQHNPQSGEQQQCLAYSYDMEQFTKYESNPIIANRKTDPAYRVDFRDPKVFANPVRGGFSMVLAAGHKLEFYHSRNFINWDKTGEFDPSQNGFGGICECPDCFMVDTENGVKWVLTLSSILEEDMVGKPLKEHGFPQAHVMQYFIGIFDGNVFMDTEKSAIPLVLDYGADNYAMVSFTDSPWPVIIGWAENWDYAARVPADTSRGKMTLARRVLLRQTADGWRLSQKPHFIPLEDRQPRIMNYSLLPGESLQFGNVRISVSEQEIRADRSAMLDWCAEIFDEKTKMPGYHCFTAPRLQQGVCPVMVLEDNGFYEIFAENGLTVFSFQVYDNREIKI